MGVWGEALVNPLHVINRFAVSAINCWPILKIYRQRLLLSTSFVVRRDKKP